LPADGALFRPILNGLNQAMQQLVRIADHIQPFMLMLSQRESQSGFQLCFS
jgi:hypothetical protein